MERLADGAEAPRMTGAVVARRRAWGALAAAYWAALAALLWAAGCSIGGDGAEAAGRRDATEMRAHLAPQAQAGVGSIPAPPPVQAAAPVEDAELLVFASLLQETRGIVEQAQRKMLAAIETAGFTVARFEEIAQARNEGAPGAEGAEAGRFDRVLGELRRLDAQAQRRAADAVEKSGLGVPRYHEIMEALQTDPGLLRRFQALLERAG